MKLPVITGRDAIPVRLIPFLTKWRLSPDVLASLLAGQHPHLHKRWTLQVRHGEGSGRVRRTVWMDHHCNMQELQESMRRHEASHLDWCRASVELLPAGAFVWRDEFEAEFSRLFGGLPVFVPRAGATELTDEQADDDLAAMVEDELSKKFGPDDEYADVSPDLPRWIEEDEEAGIDFDLLLSPDEMATVFEGFEQFTPCAPAVAVAAAVPKGVPKRAMVERHAVRWKTIETDMTDASTNGLADAAKAGSRGWLEAEALAWAEANGRLLSAPEPGTLDAVMGGGFPSRRHTLAR